MDKFEQYLCKLKTDELRFAAIIGCCMTQPITSHLLEDKTLFISDDYQSNFQDYLMENNNLTFLYLSFYKILNLKNDFLKHIALHENFEKDHLFNIYQYSFLNKKFIKFILREKFEQIKYVLYDTCNITCAIMCVLKEEKESKKSKKLKKLKSIQMLDMLKDRSDNWQSFVLYPFIDAGRYDLIKYMLEQNMLPEEKVPIESIISWTGITKDVILMLFGYYPNLILQVQQECKDLISS